MTVKENRHANLLLLIELEQRRLSSDIGGIAAVATKAGLSDKYISQIKNGFQPPKDRTPRGLGPAAAAKLEQAYSAPGEAGYGRPPGWMDRPPGSDFASSSATPMRRGAPAPRWSLDELIPSYERMDDRAKADLHNLVRDFITRHSQKKRAAGGSK